MIKKYLTRIWEWKYSPRRRKLTTRFIGTGFTVFFAVLVASLALAIGLAIFDLLVRELELSRTARESQYAIYAADTGAECALYWDLNYNGTNSAFATSTDSSPPTSNILCNTQDIAAVGVAKATWPQSEDSTSATTVFEVLLIPGDEAGPCAVVKVEKEADNPGDPSQTTITSRGHNICDGESPVVFQRALEVNY